MASVIAAGEHVEQVAQFVPLDTVSFLAIRVPVGNRIRSMLITFNVEGCPALKRGKITGKRGDLKTIIGDVGHEITVSTVPEVDSKFISNEISKHFKVDAAMNLVSVAKLKADLESRGNQKAKPAKQVGRLTATQLGVTSESALHSVQNSGPFNWVTFVPGPSGKLEFINAGGLSIIELARKLKDDDITFSLLRMGFGTGVFRRSKLIYLRYIGPKCGAVKRAKAISAKTQASQLFGAFAVEIEATNVGELSLEAVIEKVRRTAVIDGDEVQSKAKGASDTAHTNEITVESFMQSLKEEASSSAAFFGDTGNLEELQRAVEEGDEAIEEGPKAYARKSPQEVAKELLSTEESISWALFTYVL
jgi:Cofilin/tropomyosin-type actin-binding protein